MLEILQFVRAPLLVDRGQGRRDGIAQDVCWHDLRRTFGVRRLRGEGCAMASMQEVSEMLGHSTVAVTERSYAFLDGEKTAQKAAQDTRTESN